MLVQTRKMTLQFILLLSLGSQVAGSPSLTSNPDDLNGQTFDFVIVGGGAGGLALAARLSENSNWTVAVIEAGDDGSAVMERILVPALTYLEGMHAARPDLAEVTTVVRKLIDFSGIAVPGTVNDWGYMTNTVGRWRSIPRGKILGGSTAVNAMYMVRASAEEHDSWASLLPNAAEDWSWNGIYPYMLKSENFTDPFNAAATDTTVNDSYHGHTGPVHSSFPQYIYPSAALWTPTMASLGLKTSDPQGGQGFGGFLTPSSINPDNGTRSYSKSYLDAASGSSNLIVLTQSQVTQVTFDTSGSLPRATGVNFAQTSGGTTYHVEATSEVILSAGVFGTPQLLQLSGVGPKALLESLGINVTVDLPGVGEHFQDHVLVPVTWSASNDTISGDLLVQNNTFAAEQLALFLAGNLSHSMMSTPNNGIGYVSLGQLFGNDTFTAQFLQEMNDNMTTVVNNQGYTDDTLKAGYELTYATELGILETGTIGAVELLLGSFGSWNKVNRTITIQVAIQHPTSRGSVMINSTDPFAAPVIAANYLNTDADWTIMRAGVRFLRAVAATQPLKSLIVDELTPGSAVQSYADIDSYIYQVADTEYHPASTSSMLPLEKGGVVDSALKVYGTEGLRVVDASVIPIGICAHLMAPTYAIAEKAAAIIKANATQAQARIPFYSAPSTHSRAAPITAMSGSLLIFSSLLTLMVTGTILSL